MQENTQLTVSSSPHIKAKNTTQSIMADVLIALIPSFVCGTIYFGLRTVYVCVLSVLCCVLFEFLWQKICKKAVTVSDLSAVVTGMLLAFNLPPSAPFWLVLVGAFVSIIIAKQFFGGIGCNFVNPALAGRAFLLASWPVLMTRFSAPFGTGFIINADMVSSATPLGTLKGTADAALPSVLNMFIGNHAGCIGETSAAALLLGGIYLIIKKVIRPEIPLTYILTVAVLTFIFPSGGLTRVYSVLYNILGGGLFLGAIFMATDYVTSPMTTKGRIIMALGCGLLTVMIRKLGAYPEGVSYSILIMNIATPLIDKYVRPKKFGYIKKGRA